MAYVKLVINITEEAYNLLQNEGVDWLGAEHILNAIVNGKLLPKGHGRLIDADVLGEKLHRYTEAPYQYALTVFNESPTIIEADKELK